MFEVTKCRACDEGTIPSGVLGMDDPECPFCDGTGWLDGEGEPIDPDRATVDLGGGMVVPLGEVLEDDE